MSSLNTPHSGLLYRMLGADIRDRVNLVEAKENQFLAGAPATFLIGSFEDGLRMGEVERYLQAHIDERIVPRFDLNTERLTQYLGMLAVESGIPKRRVAELPGKTLIYDHGSLVPVEYNIQSGSFDPKGNTIPREMYGLRGLDFAHVRALGFPNLASEFGGATFREIRHKIAKNENASTLAARINDLDPGLLPSGIENFLSPDDLEIFIREYGDRMGDRDVIPKLGAMLTGYVAAKYVEQKANQANAIAVVGQPIASAESRGVLIPIAYVRPFPELRRTR